MKKIGVLTGGADCPGLNAVIRAVVRKAMEQGYVVTGIKNGWQGLINNDTRILDLRSTSGILSMGGSILGTSSIDPTEDSKTIAKIKENYKRSGLDAVIAIGGETTISIAEKLHRRGVIRVVGVPKSIDNELSGTDYAFGFDTAVNIATECIDRLHTTAESHNRVMVIEVLGLHNGWIAVEAGIAGGADIILIPEIPVNMEEICQSLKDRHKRGKTFSIIVVAYGTQIDEPINRDDGSLRFGMTGEKLALKIEEGTGFETRVSVLGYIQRGGSPTTFDRVLASRFGVRAVELVKESQFGKMVSLRDNKILSVDMAKAVKQRKKVDMNLVEVARTFATA